MPLPEPYPGPVPLSSFSPPVREWFERAFEAPTEAQVQAWPAIASGDNVLLSAPTGSGKTLAAFLWALDELSGERTGARRDPATWPASPPLERTGARRDPATWPASPPLERTGARRDPATWPASPPLE